MTATLTRRAGALVLIAATAATTLTGCAGVVGAQMTYDDTEKTKITEIQLDGGSGDVAIRTAAVTETSIKRIIRRSTDPGESYRLQGTKLLIDTSCGHDCSVSYEIVAPPGVKVSGELRSGDISLRSVGDTDVKLTSGDVNIAEPAGKVKLRATSGDMRVVNAKNAVDIQSTSGDIDVIDAAGPLTLKLTSGNITAMLTSAASVTAQTTSGDVEVRVPVGNYKIETHTGSGEANITGLVNDPRSATVLNLRTASGDASISAA
ncbi:DUF4097 family beta strand repeat-containing protein [Paractinoplanes brasiliensis]|uniref:Putative adhesin n=1 Tax=Paractinoplanes brasiliensis TaxID=52695 RepID=A0A4R6JQ41_9ACTN|nr:DUF4097 family beta strand repeat-containing protein [Actinoplanes brasiliensis]TDO38087.1 putative adhesin [Actinoplanes brasiliensis]GID31178.1 hypothetical protein Abr02nite_61610 [Actinoplanes brasiliensis]